VSLVTRMAFWCYGLRDLPPLERFKLDTSDVPLKFVVK
jgi:hypothetical protein